MKYIDDGLHKHMDEERPELEKQGWKFVSVNEILARKCARVHPEKRAE